MSPSFSKKEGYAMRWYYWIKMMYYKSLMDVSIRHDEVLEYYNRYIKAKARFTRRKR
jgi:hypothetical protein